MRQKAVVRKRRSIYIVWIIPFVAMAIAGWMTFKYYDEKGFDIVITFKSGEGFAVGKTPLMYKGIKVGQVSSIDVSANLTKVDVTITVDKQATGVARKGNVFWKVEPKVSLTEVTGLSTILSGAYISVMPAERKLSKLNILAYQDRFVAVEQEPIDIFEPGLLVKLHAQESGIREGAPILFRKMVVGKVLDVSLQEEGVDYLIHIENAYRHLIKMSSRFWKIDGLEIRASLSEVRVEMDSLATLLAGGITFDSPREAEPVTEHHSEFDLFNDLDEVNLDSEVIILKSQQGYNIDAESTKIYFKGMSAGYIVSIDYDAGADETTFKIKLRSAFKHLIHEGTYFWAVTPEVGLSTVKGLDAIVRGSYIAFDVHKGSEKSQKSFRLHDVPMPVMGKHFTLLSKRGHALKSGVGVKYNDIVIGSIYSMELTKDKQQMKIDIVIGKKYEELVNDSSTFYLQQAIESEISLDKMYFNVSPIETLIHGGIVLKTDVIGTKSTTRQFELLESSAAYEDKRYFQSGGKRFRLIADTLGSIKTGSAIYFKDIKVGKVIEYTLDKKSDKVEIKVYIEPKYADRINSSTRFYDISGIEIKAGLDGIDIRTDSLASILSGGIAFKTPLKANAVEEMHDFDLYKDERKADEKHVQISLQMDRGFDLKEGSKIIYKSMTVGRIKSMRLKGESVNAIALVDAEYAALFTKDALLWTEDLQVGLGGVVNASTMFSGPFLELLPGRSDELSDHFFVSAAAPARTIHQDGLRIVVSGVRLSSLKVGSPLFYRQVKVGSVEQFRLSDDARSVELMLYVDRCYAYLVRKNTIFYNATAMGMEVGVFGVKVSTETVNTMIQGGISFVTPDEALARAEEMRSFTLHDKAQESWLAWTPSLQNDEAMCE